MKILGRLFDRLEPAFAEGGLRRLHPLFRAVRRFFLSAPDAVAAAPHVRDPMDVKRFMTIVLVALLPCLAMAVWNFGPRVLAMVAVSYVVGGCLEILVACLRDEDINEGFLVTGLIFPLVLPPALPLWMVAMGIAFAVLVGKELFGGTGRNCFNPALVGRCFLSVGYPAWMSRCWIAPGTDALTGATPLALARSGQILPGADVFWGRVAGSCGETSVAAIALGALLLFATGVGRWRSCLACIGGFLGAGILLGGTVLPMHGPLLWQLAVGGLAFAAVFMVTDPVSGPLTLGARWSYGAFVGVLAFVLRNGSGYVEAVTFAVLLGNAVAPLLDELAVAWKLRRLAGIERRWT